MNTSIPKGTKVRVLTTNGGDTIATLTRDYEPTYPAMLKTIYGTAFTVMPCRLKSIEVHHDDRQFLPDSTQQGLWSPNPNFTGNKFDLFKHYEVELLKDFRHMDGGNIGARAVVRRIPSGQLYLKMSVADPVFCDDAKEGVDFKLI